MIEHLTTSELAEFNAATGDLLFARTRLPPTLPKNKRKVRPEDEALADRRMRLARARFDLASIPFKTDTSYKDEESA